MIVLKNLQKINVMREKAMSDTLKEKNEAKWKKAWKKIYQDYRNNKINEEELNMLLKNLNKKFFGVTSKDRAMWHKMKESKLEFEKKKEKIILREMKDYD